MYKRFQKKYCAIISDNNFIHTTLVDNFSKDFYLINGSKRDVWDSILKIDILIIDQDIDISIIPLHKVNVAINLTNKQIFQNEILVKKPLKLKNLLDILNSHYIDNRLFVPLNRDWVFNESSSELVSKKSSISLTDKEVKLLSEMLLSENFQVDKEFLKKNIWNYHKETESNTIDTHLYKLKQKLPENILELSNSKCELKIDR